MNCWFKRKNTTFKLHEVKKRNWDSYNFIFGCWVIWAFRIWFISKISLNVFYSLRWELTSVLLRGKTSYSDLDYQWKVKRCRDVNFKMWPIRKDQMFIWWNVVFSANKNFRNVYVLNQTSLTLLSETWGFQLGLFQVCKQNPVGCIITMPF